MEAISHTQDFEDNEDALSFSDLPLDHYHEEPDAYPRYQYLYSPSRNHDFFEFRPDLNPETTTDLISENDDIVFCGKIIEPAAAKLRNENINCDSESLTRNRSFWFGKGNRSSSARIVSSSSYSKTRSLSEMNSRKYKVLIGPARVPSTMELSEIRKRQNRRSPKPVVPVVVGEETVVAGKTKEGMHRSNWSLLKPLRYRSRLVSALTKALFACMPLV